MIQYKMDSEGVVFSVKSDGLELPFEKWKDTNNVIYYYPLSTLVDNGFAFISEGYCMVPFEHLYMLDGDEKTILGLPKMYDKAIRLLSEGMLNQPSFRYKLGYLSFIPGGDILPYQGRQGNIVDVAGERYLLNEAQYRLVSAVDEYNQVPLSEKSVEFNMRSYAKIKALAEESRCALGSYLANESVCAPEKIKIKIDRDDEGYRIEPSLDTDDGKKFTNAFEKLNKVVSVYPIQDDRGRRTRIVVNEEQRQTLDRLKRTGTRKKTGEQIRQIIDNSTEYFDPELFDVSDFYSDRVIEIGVYKPRFYPFVSPYKSVWVAGATIETPENGTSEVLIETNEDLEELVRQIEQGERNNASTIQYRETDIGIDDAKSLADIARRQLANPQKPLKDVKERKVLIIEENTEELGFSVNQEPLKVASHFVLHKNEHLDKAFSLKKHQQEGVAWLQYLHKNNASGCLIADDMGLGKTLQVLYFIDWHSRKNANHKPYLIVAPVSLLENWECEYKRFFASPRLDVVRLSSKEVPRQMDKDLIGRMEKMDIILTNYESLRNGQLNFCAVDYDVVVLDEAQKIKSPGTLATNAAKALKGAFKIAMTGTPVENSLLDLWCIMDFCVPGLMGNAKSFARHYQYPLKNPDTDLDSLGKEIHEQMGCYYLRRLKMDVAKDLPQKELITKRVQMPKEQERVYRQVVNDYVSNVQPNMLTTINQLRSISEHPYLLDGSMDDYEDQQLIESSARLQATIGFIDHIRELDEKVIVFALFKETQRMLQRIFYDRYGIMAKIINGDTPPTVANPNSNRMSRQGSINYFQSVSGFNIIIMSPVAAGMGLNVTAANHVIHYSRHWNPAKEQQATDRAYRIGQDKDVFVYYPMAVSDGFRSFDETLDDLLCRKTNLASSAIYPTASVEVKVEDFANMLMQ